MLNFSTVSQYIANVSNRVFFILCVVLCLFFKSVLATTEFGGGVLCLHQSSVSGQSGLYAGTTSPGIIFRRIGSSDWRAVSGNIGSSINCMIDYNGQIYAGVSSEDRGKIYRYNSNGSWDVVGDNLDSGVLTLEVYNNALYAGSLGGGRLYRFESAGNWTCVISYISSWSGIGALHASEDGWLYLGDSGYDYLARFDGTYVSNVTYLGGSCIYDMADFNGEVYAGAAYGRLLHTRDGQSWSSNYYGSSSNWETEPFKDALYLGNAAGTLTQVDMSGYGTVIWNAPGPIFALEANGNNALYIGITGNDPAVYRYTGTGTPERISGNVMSWPDKAEPDTLEMNELLSMKGLPGEKSTGDSATIYYHSWKGVNRDVKIVASNLTSSKGDIISSSCVKIDFSGILMPFNYTTVGVSVDIPSTAKIGDYTGTITVQSGDLIDMSMLNVKVGYSPDLVVLIKGTWNNSDFELLKYNLDSYGIKYYEYKNTIFGSGINFSGNVLSTNNALDLIENLKNEGYDNNTTVDIVAHSYGGLVARRFAQLNKENPVVNLRNIITCGTPLGGLRGVTAQNCMFPYLSWPGVSLTFTPPEMGFLWMYQHAGLYQNINNYNYYSLGGYRNPNFIGIEIGLFEYKPKDGVVPTRSVAGWPPFPEIPEPGDSENSRFLNYSHGELTSELTPVLDYIIPVIQGGKFPATYIDGGAGGGWIQKKLSTDVLPILGPVAIAITKVLPDIQHSVTFPIDNVTNLIVQTVSAVVGGDVTLLQPDGTAITGTVVDQDILRLTQFKVPTPQVGLWSVNLTTTGIGIAGGLNVVADSDLDLKPVMPFTAVPGATILLKGQLSSITDTTDVNLSAIVTAPDNSITNYTLVDDGTNGDITDSDGIFSYSLTIPQVAGEYKVIYIATGKRNGINFQRVTNSIFEVSKEVGSINALGPEYTVQTNDGCITDLKLDVSVTVPIAGKYQISADIVNSSGVRISGMFGTGNSLANGDMTLVLHVAGNIIRETGISGPYTIKNVILYQVAEDGLPQPIATYTTNYTTNAYTIVNFTHSPTLTFIDPTEDTYVVDGTTPILWNATDQDNPTSTVSLFYDTNNDGFDGTLLADKLSLNGSYLLNVSTLPANNIWIYATIDNGIMPSLKKYATGTIVRTNGEVIGARMKPESIKGFIDNPISCLIEVAHSLEVQRIANFDISISSTQYTENGIGLRLDCVAKTVSLWDQTTAAWLTATIGEDVLLTGRDASINAGAITLTLEGQIASATLALTPSITFSNIPMVVKVTDTENKTSEFSCGYWTVAEPRPDLILHHPNYGDYGSYVYNSDGLNQSWLKQVPLGVTATYYYALRNNSVVPDNIIIKGPAGTDDWNVKYIDIQTGDDVTSQMTGEGWLVANLNYYAVREMKILVTPNPAGVSTGGKEILIAAYSIDDSTKCDAIKLTTTVRMKPDLLISNLDSTNFIGDNIYNTSIGQTKSQTTATGVSAVYCIKLQNDGECADSFIISGTADTTGWRIRYFDAFINGNDITSKVINGGWKTELLPINGNRELRVEVVPNSSIAGGTRLQIQISAQSVTDTTQSDTVYAGTYKASYQPDMMIRTTDNMIYSGDNIYVTTINQSKSKKTGNAVPAVFVLKVQNDALISDKFTINGNGDTSGWTVRYYDAVSGGNDVTDQVINNVWVVGPLASGANKEFRVEVTPGNTIASAAKYDMYIYARSVSDNNRYDNVYAQTIKANYRPDMLICNNTETDYYGNDIYNTDIDQSVMQTIQSGNTAVYLYKVQNDGTSTDNMTVTGYGYNQGSNSSTSDWIVRYFDASVRGTEITSQITGSGWSTGSLAIGAERILRIEVTPSINIQTGSTFTSYMTATSVNDSSRTDTAYSVTYKSGNKPDLKIRNYSDTELVGDNIYGASTDQNVSQSVSVGKPAVYPITIQNDGVFADTFTITGTGSYSYYGWSVRYFDSINGGNEITTQIINGTGWKSQNLAVGAEQVLRVEVMPNTNVTGGSYYEVQVNTRSINSYSDSDTVSTYTYKLTHQPDMQIRASGNDAYIGSGIYGNSTDQTITKTAVSQIPVIYNFKVRNDSGHSDSFILSSSMSYNYYSWPTRVFDALVGGNDISDDMTRTGWSTGIMSAGETKEIRMEVISPINVPLQSYYNVTITARAIEEPSRTDTVYAYITKTGFQPDIMIRSINDGSYIGDNIYGTDVNQTKRLSINSNETAIYALKIQNDSGSADSFNVNGFNQNDIDGWTIRYYDALINGTDITTSIMDGSWNTGNIPASGIKEIRIEVTPPIEISGFSFVDSRIVVTSNQAPGCKDGVRAVTITPQNITGSSQPDLLIGNSIQATLIGDNKYNNEIAQTVNQSVVIRSSAIYSVVVQNDGPIPDTFNISGTGNSGDWTVRYYDAFTGGNEITSQITGTGWSTDLLPVAGYKELRVEVTAFESVPSNTGFQIQITAQSSGDDVKTDLVYAMTSKMNYQPDLSISLQPETAYSGKGVYGTQYDQIKMQNVATGIPAVYYINMNNAGQTSDRFILTAGISNTGWTIRYFDAISQGLDITDQVYGSGWISGILSPTTSCVIRVEITPDVSVSSGSLCEIQYTGRSIGDSNKSDTVYTNTYKVIYKVDAQLKSSNETKYKGEKIYNTSVEQTIIQKVANESAAIYHMKLCNNSMLSDKLLFTGPRSSGGWTIRYFDSIIDGTDITTQVTGTGWLTNVLSPGAYNEIRVEISPSANVQSIIPFEVPLRVNSTFDFNKYDIVYAQTMKSVYKTDLQVRAINDTKYIGDNIYNTNIGQTSTIITTTGVSASYILKIQNDGTSIDQFVISASGNSNNGYLLRYFDAIIGGSDITSEVIGRGWFTQQLIAGAFNELRVEVTPTPSVSITTPFELIIYSHSIGDVNNGDFVYTETSKVRYQPDMQISTIANTTFVGVGVYGSSSQQIMSQTIGINDTAVYQLRVRNDGDCPDSFRITGSDSPYRYKRNWQGTGYYGKSQYFDSVTGGNEITDDVIAGGWNTGILNVGEVRDFRVEVNMGNYCNVDEACYVSIYASSVNTANTYDIVGTETFSPLSVGTGFQPDLMISVDNGVSYLGDNLINTGGQNVTKITNSTIPAIYRIKIQNDGVNEDKINITGPGYYDVYTSDGGYWHYAHASVKYFDSIVDGNDITTDVTGSGWMTNVMSTGDIKEFRVEVTINSDVSNEVQFPITVSASSNGDSSLYDNIQIITKKVKCRPDLLISSGGDDPYIGSHYYNTWINQTISAKVSSGTSTICQLRVQNNGSDADSYTITGPSSLYGYNKYWQYVELCKIKYFDSKTDGNDITDVITGIGWSTVALAKDEIKDFRLEVTPTIEMSSEYQWTVGVTARSKEDVNQIDTVYANIVNAKYLPDVQIRNNSDIAFKGDNLYNTSLDQIVSQWVATNEKAVYIVKHQNDGSCVDSYIITGSPSYKTYEWAYRDGNWNYYDIPLCTVKYFDAPIDGNDITSDITGNGWSTGALAIGESKEIRVEITPERILSSGALYNTSVTAQSMGDNAKRDSVYMETHKIVYQPDFQIKGPNDLEFKGDHIFNNNILQTSTANIFAIATYNLLLNNYGDRLDTLSLTGPSGQNGWTVKYFDSRLNGKEITTQVTGDGGWQVNVNPLEPVPVRVEVTVSSDIKGNEVYNSTFNVVSINNSDTTDTVVALTKKQPLQNISLSSLMPSPVSVGNVVKITASGLGGGILDYSFAVGTYINGILTFPDPLPPFQSSNTYSWTPATVGDYQIIVYAREQNTTLTIHSLPLRYYVNNNGLSAVSLTSNPINAVLLGKSITLTAIATGGGSIQYKFMYGTLVLRDFASSNTYVWTPTSLKTYSNLTVVARDTKGGEVTSQSISITTKPVLSAVTLTSIPANVALFGTPITLTATTTGGANPQYKFMLGVLVLRDFASSNTLTWTPGAVKTYSDISVIVKDAGGVDPLATVTSLPISITTKTALTGIALTTSPLNSVLLGKPVTLTATATGGVNLQYKFMYGTLILRDFAVSNSIIWTPGALKTYSGLTVIVKDLGGSDSAATMTSAAVSITTKSALTGITMTTAPLNTALLGKPVTLTATATGGVNLQYKFMYGALILRDFATSNSMVWTPTAVKTYSGLTVVVKDMGGVDPLLTMTSLPVSITTKAALTAVTLATAPLTTCVVGSPVTLTATATGGITVMYKFMTGTTIIRDFASSNTCTWTPNAIQTHSLTVVTKDTGGTDPLATVTSVAKTFTVTGPLAPLSAVSVAALPDSVTLGSQVTLTATATGGATIQYKFMYGTLTLRDFAAGNSYSFTPSTAKIYSGITVTAKDTGGVNPLATVLSPAISFMVVK